MTGEQHRDGPGLAVVLSGGGARASYQAGVLSAIAERAPGLRVDILTGVSAGAINAATLAAHPGTFADAVGTLCREWRRLTPDHVYRVRPVSVVASGVRWLGKMVTGRWSGPGVVRGLMDFEPLRRFLATSLILDGIGRNITSGNLNALALSATSYTHGGTVTFVEGAAGVNMWERAYRTAVRTAIKLDHVLASAAIPIVFPAVKLADGFYGDGSVRQTAPLAPAIHLGARRILAISMRKQRDPVGPSVPIGDYPAAAEVVSLLFNSVFLDALDADVERLQRINDLIALLPPNRAASTDLRPVDLLVLRPSRDLGGLAQGSGAGLPSAVRFVIHGLGGSRKRASDLPQGRELRLTLRTNSEGRVGLAIEGGKEPGSPKKILNDVEGLVSIWSLNRAGDIVRYAGAETLEDTWGLYEIPLAGAAFVQVNRDVAMEIDRYVREHCGPVEGLRIVDAYCGFGLTAIDLAQEGARVIGIDLDRHSIATASSIASELKATARFLRGNVERLLPRQLPADIVILNPPRRGVAKPAIEALANRPPRRIVYISCNPATLARDLKALTERFALEACRGFDLFPQTAHVETVATLTRR